jgi:hypothetical protein
MNQFILDDCIFLLHLIDSLEELIRNYNIPQISMQSTFNARSTVIRSAILDHDAIVRRLFAKVYTEEAFPEDPEDKRVVALTEAVRSQLK